MKLYTVGYGGRMTEEFLALLKLWGITVVVDVRLRPDRSSLGVYVRAKSPDKGIQALLARGHIEYVSLVELGNVFKDFHEEWAVRYARLIEVAGNLLTARLVAMMAHRPQEVFCLMCAEKRVADCHRKTIAAYLESRGYEVEHIE